MERVVAEILKPPPYFAVGLMGHVFHGLQAALPALNATLMTRLAVPAVVLVVAAMLRRVTARLH